MQERLSAVCAALRLLGPHQQGKASAKLAKALDALKKAKVGWGPAEATAERCGDSLGIWRLHTHGRLLGHHMVLRHGAACLLTCLPSCIQTLAQVEEEQQAEREAATAKEAAKKQQSAGKTGMSAEEKARLKVGLGSGCCRNARKQA